MVVSKTISLQAFGESNVLTRVRAFLPVLDEANRKLTKAIKEKGAEEYAIEVLNGHEHEDASYVEMDLALGVTDLHTPAAISAAERLVGGRVVHTTLSRNEEDSDSDDGNTDDESDGDIQTEEGKDLLMGRKKRPKIELLS